jgi:hypothetical protein
VYNTGGLDSRCFWVGAKAAHEGMSDLLAAYRKGREDARRDAGLPHESEFVRVALTRA